MKEPKIPVPKIKTPREPKFPKTFKDAGMNSSTDDTYKGLYRGEDIKKNNNKRVDE